MPTLGVPPGAPPGRGHRWSPMRCGEPVLWAGTGARERGSLWFAQASSCRRQGEATFSSCPRSGAVACALGRGRGQPAGHRAPARPAGQRQRLGTRHRTGPRPAPARDALFPPRGDKDKQQQQAAGTEPGPASGVGVTAAARAARAAAASGGRALLREPAAGSPAPRRAPRERAGAAGSPAPRVLVTPLGARASRRQRAPRVRGERPRSLT